MGIRRWHLHIDHMHYDGMQAFYLNALMRSLVFSMIGIFTPVFVYTSMLAVTGQMTHALASVAGYYFLVRLVVLLLNVPMAKLIEKIGFRRSVLASAFILMLYVAALVMAGGDYRYLPIAAILLGANIPLYWVSRGSVIALDSKRTTLGKQMGLLAVLERIAGIAGPVAAGLMIEAWGFPVMYTAAGLILIVSVIPLWSMPHHVHRNGVSWRGYAGWIKDRRFFHQGIGVMGRAIDEYGFNIVWPLSIVLMGVHYSQLGGVWSILTLITVAYRYGSGYIFDKLYKKKGWEDEALFGLAAVGTSMAWLARMFVGSLTGVLMLDGGSMVFATTWRNISQDYDMLGGKRMHEIAYFTYKEMTYSAAILLICVMWAVGAYLGVWKELIFGMAALWIIMSIVQARESNLK